MIKKLKFDDKKRFILISKAYKRVDQVGFNKPLFSKFFSIITPSEWKGKIVLDVGCGDGRFIPKFTEKGAFIIGLDSSINVLKTAKKNNPNAQFIQASATHIPIKKEALDLCIILGLLHHFTDKFVENIISEIKRIIKKDSIFLFDLRNSLNPFLFLQYKRGDRINFTMKSRSLKKIKKIIKKFDIKIITKVIVPFPSKISYLWGPFAPILLILCKKK